MVGHAPESLVKQIVRRKRAGDTNAQIAAVTGISETAVRDICQHRHVKLRDNNRLVYKVSPELRDACCAEAERRQMTINAPDAADA
jgi:hypothetical protein